MYLKVLLMRISLNFLILEEGLMSQMSLPMTKRILQVGKLAHEGPSDTRDTKIVALRLEFNAFKSLESEKVNGIFTRLRCLLNDNENNGVSIPQAEVNATFVNSVPRKWLSMNQTQRANNSIKNDCLATLYGKYNYEEGLIDHIYESETQRFNIHASSSKALISNNHFQDSDSDVEKDQRTSNEFIANLNVEYHERALLANQKRFYKRSRRVGSARIPIDKSKETCFACGKPGHFQKDCPSNKTSTPSYPSSNNSSNKLKPYTPSFNQTSSQNTGNHQKNYKGKYKDEGTIKIRAFMAIAKDEPSVGKVDAKSSQWVDITMKKVYRLLSMTDGDERKHVLDYTHVDLYYVKDQRKNLADESSSMSIPEITSDSESECETQEPLLPLPKLIETKPTSVNVSPTYVIKKRTENKPPVVFESYSCKKAYSSTEQLLLTLMEEIKGLKSFTDHLTKEHLEHDVVKKMLIKLKAQSPKKASMIPKSFKECKYCRFNDHHSENYEYYPRCEVCGSVAHEPADYPKKKIENLNEVRVKKLKSDNEIEFKNHKLEELCDEKGISQNSSSPCTLEQNGVAERRNITLIEAAKTMLNSPMMCLEEDPLISATSMYLVALYTFTITETTWESLMKKADDEVPAICMQEFYATVSVHKSSIKFIINKKKFCLDVEIFREILLICPKIPRQDFDDLPLEHDILSFIRDLRHSGDIIYLTDVSVDYLHQPWRAFATIINKFLSGKETGMEKFVCLVLKSSRIENKEVKKTNKKSYPRFTKIIIDYFMSKDQSISRRNKMFWHTARDDTMYTSMGSYKTYYAIASGEKTSKPNYIRKKADSDTSPKQKPVQATKGTRLKTKAKVAKSNKKKQPTKKPKAKGLVVLSDVALTEAEQLKLTTKKSKTQFHNSHASGLGDGVDIQSKVPNEQQQKTSESWGGSGEEDEDDENGSVDKSDGNDDDDDDPSSDDHDDDSDDERTKSDRDEIPDPNLTNVDQTEHEEEDFDERVHTPSDYELIDDEKIHDEGNINDEERMEEEEDEKTGGLTQSSSVSSNFTSKLLNLNNPSPADNEITFLMDTTAHHATTIPEITSSFTITIPPPPLFFNPLSQKATPTLTSTTSETTTSLSALPDFTYVFKFNERVTNLEKDLSKIKQVDQYAQALSSIPALVDHYMDNKLGEAINKAIKAYNFDYREEAQAEKGTILVVATLVIEKNVTESLKADVLTRSSSQLQSLYEAAATLFKFELTKILIEKMKKNKSFDIADYKRELYNTLVKSYNTEKDIFESYDETEGRKEESQARKLNLLEIQGQRKRSLQAPLRTPQSQHKSFSKSAHAEEPKVTKADWFKKPERHSTLDPDWSKRLYVDFRPPQTWISQVARAKEPPTSFYELNDTSFDFSAFVRNRLKIPNLAQEILGGDLSRRYSTSVTKTKAATYDLKWNEYLVPKFWNLVQVKYDQHAYLGFTLGSQMPKLLWYRRKRLMRADELQKFRDGMLNDVRSALHDIDAGIRMEYLPMRKWSNLDKKRA
nr:putative ribonuclease H-like domain-containing protein [Tanacetum cinerariifolium]